MTTTAQLTEHRENRHTHESSMCVRLRHLDWLSHLGDGGRCHRVVDDSLERISQSAADQSDLLFTRSVGQNDRHSGRQTRSSADSSPRKENRGGG